MPAHSNGNTRDHLDHTLDLPVHFSLEFNYYAQLVLLSHKDTQLIAKIHTYHKRRQSGVFAFDVPGTYGI
ncbi:hypothetical protein AFLA_010901 [Aspergillus flavus NRRL3357]|nr:hypothetical protein AFLA_010901 [Aspergillus flavus NRRL3357]